MKLRSRTRMTTDDSSFVTATVPVIPPDITRLQTPPISERSNAGSTVARKDRLSELSSTIMDLSDAEEAIKLVSPTKDRHRPTITVPADPLTKSNLARHQDEITSAVEITSEGESLSPTTPNARLTQVRNYLLTEDINTDPDFKSHFLQIAQYLSSHRGERSRQEKEVLQLLRQHGPYVAASKQRRPPHSLTTERQASRAVTSLPAEDDPDPEKKADPFEWTNKLGDLTQRVKASPSAGREDFAVSHLRELARPLNGGRLPSAVEAYNLIDERMGRENHENVTPSEINHDRPWAFETNPPPASQGKEFSLDRRSGHPPLGSRASAARVKLGDGSLMPREMRDVDWDRDRARLEEHSAHGGLADRGGAQLLLAETPFLQALMSDQIESDLAAGTLIDLCSGSNVFKGEESG